ncbi:MAG: hypothetical protein JXB05_02800 [Myxococcaceae bacterium]|nr:hypothetical protein [Myxococcaceae bacterium]
MLLLVGGTTLTHAASPSADLPVQAPPGWISQKQDGALLLTPGDIGDGRFYAVMVPELQRKVGSLAALVETAQAMLAETGTFTPISGPTRGRNAHGWEYDLVIGSLEKDGKALLAKATGLKKGDEEGIVIVIADSVETMEMYSDPLLALLQGVGASSAAPVPSQNVDLRYRVPAGWTATPVESGVLLARSKSEEYEKYAFLVVIFPSEPLRDSLRKTYLAKWAEIVKPELETEIAPLPLMHRLESGTAIAYDMDSSAKTQDGQEVSGGLYLVARGKRVVPLFVVLFGSERGKPRLEADLTALLESAEIPGAGSEKTAIYSPDDLVGEWSESSASLASYVTASGAYAGDASVATASSLVLNADGSFRSSFKGLSSQTTIQQEDTGTWKLEDTLLVQTGKERQVNWVLGVGADPKAGAFLVLSPGKIAMKQRYSDPRGDFQGEWLKRKD